MLKFKILFVVTFVFIAAVNLKFSSALPDITNIVIVVVVEVYSVCERVVRLVNNFCAKLSNFPQKLLSAFWPKLGISPSASASGSVGSPLEWTRLDWTGLLSTRFALM